MELLEVNGIYPRLEPGMFDRWSTELQRVAHNAGLSLHLEPPAPDLIAGRRGRHSAAFGPLLDELTEVYRVEPEAAW